MEVLQFLSPVFTFIHLLTKLSKELSITFAKNVIVNLLLEEGM